MVSLEEFHQDFLQTILSDSESRNLMKPQAFLERVCDDLVSVGDLTSNCTSSEYIKKTIEIYGYDYDLERKVLTLITHEFFQEDEIQTLTKSQIDVKFNRLRTFFNKSIEGLYKDLEETSEAYSMAYKICEYFTTKQIEKVRLMILTDGKATKKLTDLNQEEANGFIFEFRIIDIEYLKNIYESETDSAFFDVKVDLPCLKVNDKSNSYQSYLTVISGDELVRIYSDHGKKLFEQNVRTFLQFKGNVNKGLRNTIEFKSEMFFAYNNGITATATEVEIGTNGNIVKIENFQIVNGGQTTSAIYAAKTTSKIDVSKISVQMKLSVVKNIETQDDFISKVAEYANTQNKINNSDFFSNSPFHKDMKSYATRIYAPAIGGSQRRTHWYYERVRGEYLNSQAYLKVEAKNKFLLENPKSQVVDKTLLSKTENLWRKRPDLVSKGAQESFKRFAEDITEILEKDNLAITERYYKDAICRVILFRNVEKIVSKSSWYDGGFRAQTVAYTISYLSALTTSSGMYLNFELIWMEQELPKSLIEMLKTISKEVYQKITHPPSGYANVAQWTKNPKCWVDVQTIELDFDNVDSKLFIDKQELNYIAKESKGIKILDGGINAQIFVLSICSNDWIKIYQYYKSYKGVQNLTSAQLDLLYKASLSKISCPSEKQSKILFQVYTLAKAEGLDLV